MANRKRLLETFMEYVRIDSCLLYTSFTFITSVLFLPNQGDLFRNVSNIFIKITQDIFCLPACLCLLVGGLLAHAVAVSDSL